MTAAWTLATEAVDPGFGPWLGLDAALATSTDEPGLYLIRSRHLAEHHWPSGGDFRRPWTEPGVIYIGISLSLRRRLRQFAKAAETRREGYHPGGYWFQKTTRDLALYAPARERWRSDLQVAFAAPVVQAPSGVVESEPRWASAVRLSLEAIEASIVSDVMAHRLASGCAWRLLNHVDRSTYQER